MRKIQFLSITLISWNSNLAFLLAAKNVAGTIYIKGSDVSGSVGLLHTFLFCGLVFEPE